MIRLVLLFCIAATVAFSESEHVPAKADLQNKSESLKDMLAQESVNQKTEFEALKIKLNELEDQLQLIKNQKNDDQNRYKKISDLWKTLIDASFDLNYDMADQLSKGLLNPEYLEHDLPGRQDILQKHQRLIQQSKEYADQTEHLYYNLLDKTSALRAELLKSISETSTNLFIFILNYRTDFYYELKAIPTRIIKNFSLWVYEFKNSFQNGISGFFQLLSDLIFFLISVTIPFFSFIVFRKLAESLTVLKQDLWKRSDKKYAIYANILQKTSPYLGWIVCYFVLGAMSRFWLDTLFEDFNQILPIISLYIHFRIFLLAFVDFSNLIKNSFKRHVTGFKLKSEQTAKLLGRYYFYTFTSLYIVNYCVGHGLVYQSLYQVFHIWGVILILYTFATWSGVLINMIQVIPAPFIDRVTLALNHPVGKLCSFPVFIACALVALMKKSMHLMEKIEIFRTLMIKINRTKIEMSQADDAPHPEDTGVLTAYSDFYLSEEATKKSLSESIYQDELKIILSEINGWLTDHEDDHTIALIGGNGCGKSTLLDTVELRAPDIEVLRIDIPPKITSNSDLKKLLQKSFHVGEEESNLKLVKKFNDTRTGKTLILVDNAHHLFISDVDGLTAFRTFLSVISLETENIFWVVTFNQFAFSYLKGIMGFTQHFRTELHLGKWSIDDIRTLLMGRHALSGYKLSYEKIGQYALLAENDDIEHKMESQFHSILWEQSGGNPKIAIQLWLRSLSVTRSKTLEVILPEKMGTDLLMTLDDNAWFVLAAIARHRCLTKKEAAQACNFASHIVSHALKVCLDHGIVSRASSRRYELSFDYQSEIVKQLKMKNFIYET